MSKAANNPLNGTAERCPLVEALANEKMNTRGLNMTKHTIIAISLILLATCGAYADVSSHEVDYFHELLVFGDNSSQVPDWIVSVEQEHGTWLEQPCRWVANSGLQDGQGRILIEMDRKKLRSDVGISLICETNHNADIAVQLLDSKGRVIAVDLVGNAISIEKEAQTDTFAIPFRRHPTATTISIQRIGGDVTIHGVVLFPLIIGDDTETELCDKVELLRLLNLSLSTNSPTLRAIVQLMRERQLTETNTNTAALGNEEDTHAPSYNVTVPEHLHSSSDHSTALRKVAIDLRHGSSWQGGIDLLRRNNYQPILLESQITTNSLVAVATLIIAADGVGAVSFNESEVEAIVDFVKDGGGLLCAAQAWSWAYKAYGNKPVEDYPLNSLGKICGFTITGSNIGAPAYASEPFVTNVSEIVRDGWWPSRILFSSRSARPFIRDNALRAMAGSLRYEKGKVVVLGHGSMLRDNPKLVTNILSYLTSRGNEEKEMPTTTSTVISRPAPGLRTP